MEDMVKRGIKRKWEPHVKEKDTMSKLRAKLHHGLKEVKKATKKVRTFETQKVVKKLKDARRNEDEINIKNLEAQLESLKHIDLDDVAVRSLRSKIRKDTLLSRNTDCQEAVSAELSFSENKPRSDSSVQALVESRVLSSKILALEVSNVIHALKLVLNVGREETPETDEDNDASNVEESEEEREGNSTTRMKAPPPTQGFQADENMSGIEDEEETGEEVNDRAAWSGFDEMHSEPEQSEDSEDWKSGTLHEDDDAQSSASDNTQSTSPQRPSPAKKTRSASLPKQNKSNSGESTFLPSLSVGFISGSSDSEWSDAEAKIADLTVKKNRRGQRARKAIWEKKYGKNANHLRKQHENDVRDAARTAYGQRGGRGRGASMSHAGVVRGRGPPIFKETQAPSPHIKATQANHGRDQRIPHRPRDNPQVQCDSVDKLPSNVRPQIRSRGDDSKPIHPSWEAKRRLKEKESPAIVPSTGARIKFT